jgi:hypothetical protein
MSFPFEPNKQSRRRPFYDIRKDLPGFETIAAVKKESQIRQASLIKVGNHQLAAKLADCAIYCRCMSPACPLCVRINRRGFYHAATRLSKRHKMANKRIVTLIYYSEAMTSEQLEDFYPNRLKERVRKQLTRCGFQNPVIGGLELDYHEDIGLWVPHLHLLVVDDIPALKTLRKRYLAKEKRPTSDSTPESYISRPMLEQDLNDPPEQLSYLCKQRWHLIRTYKNPETGKRRTRKLRLKKNEFIQSLTVLDSYTFSDLMFTFKVRVNCNEFRVAPSVCERKGENH